MHDDGNRPTFGIHTRGRHKKNTVTSRTIQINRTRGPPESSPPRAENGISSGSNHHLTQLPEDWRKANTPIFKRGDRHLVLNYRPVSSTCVCYKRLEHVIWWHIREHLHVNKILTPQQHDGFHRWLWCETKLLVTLQDLMSLSDQKIWTDVVVLDFSKAFDTIPHDKLLGKLKEHVIHGKTWKWVSIFFEAAAARCGCWGSSVRSSICNVRRGTGKSCGPYCSCCIPIIC